MRNEVEMIIALSGWRGIPNRPDNQAAIREAAADTLRGLFCAHPDARYRVGDCPTGWDAAIKILWTKQWNRHGWYGDGPRGRRFLDATWIAEWSKHGPSAGPKRNRAMLRGDGTGDPEYGFADMLVAMPQPGPRRDGSGTWSAIDIAHELCIETHSVALTPARRTFDMGARRLSILPT